MLNGLKNNCDGYRVFNYAGLRSDEDRMGYQPKSAMVTSVFPFVSDGLILDDIKRILIESGIGLPEYYSWRQRSGCYFCFYQRDNEWRGLRRYHPNLFEQACILEENHLDGRYYTWRDSGFLRNLSEIDDITPTENLNHRPKLMATLSNLLIHSPKTKLFRSKGGQDE